MSKDNEVVEESDDDVIDEKKDHVYKYRLYSYKRSLDIDGIWEIMDHEGNMIKNASKGSICRKMIDAMMENRPDPIDPGLRRSFKKQTNEPSALDKLAEKTKTRVVLKDKYQKELMLIDERVRIAEENAFKEGKKIIFVDLTDVDPKIFKELEDTDV